MSVTPACHESALTYSDVESLNSLEKTIWLVHNVARAARILASSFLKNDTLVNATSGPEALHLLLVKPVDHDIALDFVEVVNLRVAEVAAGWVQRCWP